MARRRVGGRFWFASSVAAVGTVLFVLTLVVPDWIEEVFHVDPDRGSGTLEVAIAVGLLAVAGISGLVAHREWRRPAPHGGLDR